MISEASENFPVDLELSWIDALDQVLVVVTVEDEAASFAGILTGIMHAKDVQFWGQTLGDEIWLLEVLVKGAHMHGLVVGDDLAGSVELCSWVAVVKVRSCAVVLSLLRIKTPWVNDEVLKAQDHVSIFVLSSTLLHQL